MSLYLPREKADFNFLDFVNDYEKTTGVEARVDFLLVMTELLRQRSLTFAQLVEMTQRDEKFVREAVTEWAGQNVLLASDQAGYFVLAPNALRKMTGKSVYLRQTDAEIEAHRHKLESFLRSEGTINRAKIMEFCQLTEKQTNLILRKMLESGEIVKIGSGRSTSYQLAPKIVPSV